MNEISAIELARLWTKSPESIETYLKRQVVQLRDANVGKVRLLWMVIEDRLDTATRKRLAPLFLETLAHQDAPASRAAIIMGLVEGAPDDLQHPQGIERATQGWDLGYAWARAKWGDHAAAPIVETLARLMRPDKGYREVLSHILAEMARHDPAAIAAPHLLWSWMKATETWNNNVHEILPLLVQVGVCPDAPNESGLTALQILSLRHNRLHTKIHRPKNSSFGTREYTTRLDMIHKATDMLVSCGADWTRLNPHKDRLLLDHLEQHPRVRADRLRAGLTTLSEKKDQPRQL